MTTTPAQPTTAAGRALLEFIADFFDGGTVFVNFPEQVASIEAEAAAAATARAERAEAVVAAAADFVDRVQEYARLNLRRDGRPGPLEVAAASLSAVTHALIGNEPQPDHRQCRCGHLGSVHEGTPTTKLGYASVGIGPCLGRSENGKSCACDAFALAAAVDALAESER